MTGYLSSGSGSGSWPRSRSGSRAAPRSGPIPLPTSLADETTPTPDAEILPPPPPAEIRRIVPPGAEEDGGRSRRDETERDAGSVLGLLLRRWWVLLLAVLVGVGGGVALAGARADQYTATAYLIGRPRTDASTDSALVLASGKVYSHLATDPLVVGPSLRRAGLSFDPKRVNRIVTAVPASDSPVLEIRARTRWPRLSVRYADTVAAAVVKASTRLGAKTGYEMQPLGAATVPAAPDGPGTAVYAIAGGALGLLLAGAGIILIGDRRRRAE